MLVISTSYKWVRVKLKNVEDEIYWSRDSGDALPSWLRSYLPGQYAHGVGFETSIDEFEWIEVEFDYLGSGNLTQGDNDFQAKIPDYPDGLDDYSSHTLTVTIDGVTKTATSGFKYEPSKNRYGATGLENSYNGLSRNIQVDGNKKYNVASGNDVTYGVVFRPSEYPDDCDASWNGVKAYVVIPDDCFYQDVWLEIDGARVPMVLSSVEGGVDIPTSGGSIHGVLYIFEPEEPLNLETRQTLGNKNEHRLGVTLHTNAGMNTMDIPGVIIVLIVLFRRRDSKKP